MLGTVRVRGMGANIQECGPEQTYDRETTVREVAEFLIDYDMVGGDFHARIVAGALIDLIVERLCPPSPVRRYPGEAPSPPHSGH